MFKRRCGGCHGNLENAGRSFHHTQDLPVGVILDHGVHSVEAEAAVRECCVRSQFSSGLVDIFLRNADI